MKTHELMFQKSFGTDILLNRVIWNAQQFYLFSGSVQTLFSICLPITKFRISSSKDLKYDNQILSHRNFPPASQIPFLECQNNFLHKNAPLLSHFPDWKAKVKAPRTVWGETEMTQHEKNPCKGMSLPASSHHGFPQRRFQTVDGRTGGSASNDLAFSEHPAAATLLGNEGPPTVDRQRSPRFPNYDSGTELWLDETKTGSRS